jgi:hypothetical protein
MISANEQPETDGVTEIGRQGQGRTPAAISGMCSSKEASVASLGPFSTASTSVFRREDRDLDHVRRQFTSAKVDKFPQTHERPKDSHERKIKLVSFQDWQKG